MKKLRDTKPPRLADSLFYWYCKNAQVEDLHGDMEEMFFVNLKKMTLLRAKLIYWKQILSLVFSYALKRRKQKSRFSNYATASNNTAMLKNYFKTSLRNLLKNKGYTLINTGGLAIGIAGFLLIIQYVRFERSYENFNVNAGNIYRVTTDLYKGSEYVVTDCETYAPLAPMLKAQMPEVVDYVRMMDRSNQEIKVGTVKFFEERVFFADPSVFTVFTYKMVAGNPKTALTDPYQVVITSSMAKKYFGQDAAVGQSMEIGHDLYKVTAVIEDVPENTHLKFDFLLSHNTIPKFWKDYSDESWNTGNNEYTYLLMKPGTQLADFNKKLTAFSASMKEKIGDERFTAENENDIHLYSDKTFEPEANGNAKTVYFLLVIATFIIVLAWVNYINLSTARAMERAREVGIRKVLGSFRRQLVFQFLSESVIVNLLAIGVALLLVRISTPFFLEVSGQPVPVNIFKDQESLLMLAGILMAGVVLSGLYPSLVLSSFEPITVLKGKFKASGHGQWLRKSLVVFQFAATAILIICLTTVYLQVKYMRSHDLGINIDQTLVLRAPSVDMADATNVLKFETFKNELLKNQQVKDVVRSGSMPGLSLNELGTSNNIVRYGDQKKDGGYNYYHYYIDAGYIPAFGIKLIAGRNFEKGVPNKDVVIINEEAVRTLGFNSPEEAVSSKITFRTTWDIPYSTIIGVVKNFNQRSPKEKQIPMILDYSNDARFFSVKLNSPEMQETLAAVKTTWDSAFPDSAFTYFFLDEKYNQQYKADQQFGQVIGTFSGLAILIASLGLFGLSSFTILQRTKEIGIRKVLGGSVLQITRLLSRDFIQLVVIAGVVAVPFAYFAMNEWLSHYTTRITLGAWIFILPMLIIVVISLLTVGFQTIKAAQSNPVNSLRTE